MHYHDSRRNFLTSLCKGAAAASVAVTFGSTLLSSCKKNPPPRDTNPLDSVSNAAGDIGSCPSSEGLTEDEIKIRKSLNYTDQSKVPNRFCDNCKLYTLPKDKQTLCGGCKIIPGPVHPKGYCTAWYQLM